VFLLWGYVRGFIVSDKTSVGGYGGKNITGTEGVIVIISTKAGYRNHS